MKHLQRIPLFRLLQAAGIFGLYVDDPNAPSPPAPKPPEPQTFSAEYVRELREENKGWRLKASEQETAAKTAKDAATAAETAAQAKITEATTAANQRVIRAELKAAALKAGMVDLDGLKLADLSTVKLNEAGDVEGADELMEAMKKAKPYLFGAPNTTNPNPTPKPNDPKPKHVRELDDKEYEAKKRELLGR